MMNKEDLTREIDKIKASLEAHESQVKDLNRDLEIAKIRLEDCEKPKLTQKQFTELHKVIENSVENFDFNQVDNYNVEMGMEYDNKVYLDNIEFECHADLYEQIIYDVEKLFGVADESDDDEESPSE
jgi:GTPase involved in cell partitioning and DNA repair